MVTQIKKARVVDRGGTVRRICIAITLRQTLQYRSSLYQFSVWKSIAVELHDGVPRS